MPLDHQRIKALFQSAYDIVDPADRVAFLDRECGGDAELRRRVDGLLAAADRPGVFPQGPLVAEETAADFALGSASGIAPDATIGLSDHGAIGAEDASIPAGATVGFSAVGARPKPGPASADLAIGTLVAGRYKLRQVIGEGGMGTVYLAEQVQPVRRQVALKLIRAGMDSRTVLARFESERQALAIMDHPNIARVLDAGTTESGYPFFVMELVRGVPLTDFCDAHRLDLPTRLNLFRLICGAVQHAHQKGIIHRDLKPTNILVESHDGAPVPKVIDFGLAKATSGLTLTEASLFTAFGTIAGTPLYMAPEQALFNALDVDTRADIYALGVILYELLTGSTPIRKESLQRAALDEILRVIREDEPPTPSHRISTSEALPGLAATRQVEPVRLGRFVRGDLDWIVMKALAKERARRYDSAIGLANDVERFLHDEPVTAGPPTARYRTAKFIRRHRRQVVAASLIVLALVGGTVGTTVGLFEARRQRDLARAETAEKERARAAEAEQRRGAEAARRAEARSRQTAERRSAQLGRVNDILGSIFRDLNLEQAEQEGKPVVAAIGERLDGASAALEGESTGDPLTVARMQVTLGQAQVSLTNYTKAITLLERARASLQRQSGPDDTTTLSCSAALGWAYDMEGSLDRAIALLEPTVAAMNVKLGPDDPVTLNSAYNLASVYVDAGRFDRAIPLHEQTLRARMARLGPDHPDTIRSMDYLGHAYRLAGQIDLAALTLEQAVEAAKGKLGPDHVLTLMCMSDLGNAYIYNGRLDRAIALHDRVMEARRAKLGADNNYTVISMSNLSKAYEQAGRLDRAIPLAEQSLAMSRAKLRPDHYETLIAASDLGLAYAKAGRFDRATLLLEQTVEMMKTATGPDHLRTLVCMDNLGNAYRGAGRLDRATALHEQTLATTQSKLGPDHPAALACMADLAQDYRFAGQNDRALLLFEQAWTGRRVKLGPGHPDTLRSMTDLAGVSADTGAIDKAIALDRECLTIHRSRQEPDSLEQAYARTSAGSRLLQAQRWAEAEPLLREALATRAAIQPDDWKTFHTRSLLGVVLLSLGKYDEARPLLVEGFEGMKQRLTTIPAPDRIEPVAALDRLVRLAETTNNPAEATRWREEKTQLEAQSIPPASTGATPPNAGAATAPPTDAKPVVPVDPKPAPAPTPAPAGGRP